MAHDSQSGVPPKADVASWLMTLVTAAMLLLLSGVFFILIPKLEMTFHELGIALPGLTELIITVHRSFLWPVLIVAAAANIIKEVSWNGYPGIAAFNAIGLFVVFVLAMVMVIGLFIPVVGIIENISAQSPP